MDALKDDPALAKKKDDEPKQEPAEKKEDGKKEEPKQQAGLNVRGGDGIPPLAQLKALRAEQVAIKLQTKEFTEQHPNLDNLTDDEQAELDAIRNEQGQLRDLFNQIVQSRKGEQP